jgi:hypothetical protein
MAKIVVHFDTSETAQLVGKEIIGKFQKFALEFPECFSGVEITDNSLIFWDFDYISLSCFINSINRKQNEIELSLPETASDGAIIMPIALFYLPSGTKLTIEVGPPIKI